MTGRFLSPVFRVLVVFLVVLLPAGVRSQEQNQPASPAPVPENAAQEQPQKPADAPSSGQGTLIVPGSQEKTDSEQGEVKPELSKESGGKYIIKQGDTLWDISNAFLKDPFLWPFIWKANPYITNADLIYPGNTLVIPSMAPIEEALQAPDRQEPVERAAEEQPSAIAVLARKKPLESAPTTTDEQQAPVNKLILPEEAPVPIMDKYSMLNAGFVTSDETRDIILGSKEGKTILGYDDVVYVRIGSKDAAVGDKFIIFRPLKRVKHPVTGETYGRLVKVLGILELLEKGRSETYSARITLSFDAAEKGSMLTPYQEPMLIYNDAASSKDKTISGYILEVLDTRTINAQTDIVYLDKGSADGVDPGDRFEVFTRTEKDAYPKHRIGEAQVFLVKEHTSTAVVRKSTDTMAKGNKVEYRKLAPAR